VRPFDLDHARAKIGQLQRGGRAGEELGHVEHQQIGQGAWASRRRRCVRCRIRADKPLFQSRPPHHSLFTG
jgi:hypothetical protein